MWNTAVISPVFSMLVVIDWYYWNNHLTSSIFPGLHELSAINDQEVKDFRSKMARISEERMQKIERMTYTEWLKASYSPQLEVITDTTIMEYNDRPADLKVIIHFDQSQVKAKFLQIDSSLFIYFLLQSKLFLGTLQNPWCILEMVAACTWIWFRLKTLITFRGQLSNIWARTIRQDVNKVPNNMKKVKLETCPFIVQSNDRLPAQQHYIPNELRTVWLTAPLLQTKPLCLSRKTSHVTPPAHAHHSLFCFSRKLHNSHVTRRRWLCDNIKWVKSISKIMPYFPAHMYKLKTWFS